MATASTGSLLDKNTAFSSRAENMLQTDCCNDCHVHYTLPLMVAPERASKFRLHRTVQSFYHLCDNHLQERRHGCQKMSLICPRRAWSSQCLPTVCAFNSALCFGPLESSLQHGEDRGGTDYVWSIRGLLALINRVLSVCVLHCLSDKHDSAPPSCHIHISRANNRGHCFPAPISGKTRCQP